MVAAAAVAACAPRAVVFKPLTDAAPLIQMLDVGTGTNAYVIQGTRPILVDTGWGDSTEKIEAALAEIGVKPANLALIIVTHGHGDHAGGANRLRQLSGAKVLAGQPDVEMLQAGHNRPLIPMYFLARMVRPLADKPFPAFTPDIAITGPFDLKPYGVDGVVIPTPGHTPGSVSVLLPSGDAIVGDVFRGSGLFRSDLPTRHYFHDDCRAAEAHIKQLYDKGVRRFFVGHGGPVDAKLAVEHFETDPCP